ncbi:hypothetical protein Aph01nite_43210 [Acrocarpospora phusangensis]|uniref:Uncharacterized protein n=1 Tax=Acrocarpospora phusangensis TaxID=1070424 RepID=A0A919ULC4_9ACTN|nr:hypothetical protein [Acrocarpospora phusangensis]GIH26011.1 hypothetical protein Aph01nite_43210 [Acrocarpospora phusangensis]
MKTETYRGVKLKVKKGREWGYLTYFVNGVSWGDHLGRDEEKALASMHGYVDMAIERPADFEPYWQPGYRKPKPRPESEESW